jgi:CRP-like cAMP-binding protein
MGESLSTTGSASSEVFLSGRAGYAVVRSADAFYRLSVDEPEPSPCDATYWSHLRGLHPDGVVLRGGAYPFIEAQRALRSSWQRDRCLSLALIALDVYHKAELRGRACSAAELLIAELDTGAFLRTRLLSRIPPSDADFEGAALIAKRVAAEQLHQLFAEVEASRSAIVAVLAAWDRLARDLPTPADRVDTTRVIEHVGAVARLVTLVRSGMRHEERSASTQWFISTVVPALRIPQPLVLLNRWLNDVSPKSRRREVGTPSAAMLWVREETVAEAGQDPFSKGKPKPRGYGVKQRVDAQKSAILSALAQGKNRQIERYVNELLRKIPVFKPLTEREARKLAARARRVVYGPLDRIVIQGHKDSSLFLVASGTVEVLVRQEDGRDLPIATLETGAVFGEYALLTGEERTATVRAIDEVVVYAISKEALQPIIEARPQLVVELSLLMAARQTDLRDLNERQSQEQEAARSMAGRIRRFFLG